MQKSNGFEKQRRSSLMESHGRFHWNELMTRDVEKAKKFYADTLGWSFEAMPMPDGTYWIATIDGEPVAGIFDIGGAEYQGVNEMWMPYIAVDDIDARVRQAAQAGAKVMKEPFDVPGVGRIAMLTEPGGAGIGWMTPAE
jgi:predicted enzyme related to lactoylglutathione lyase